MVGGGTSHVNENSERFIQRRSRRVGIIARSNDSLSCISCRSWDASTTSATSPTSPPGLWFSVPLRTYPSFYSLGDGFIHPPPPPFWGPWPPGVAGCNRPIIGPKCVPKALHYLLLSYDATSHAYQATSGPKFDGPFAATKTKHFASKCNCF